MKIDIDYGRSGLSLDVPDDATVVRPRARSGLPDPLSVIRRRVREPTVGEPLRELARGKGSVAISVCDGTRPQPRKEVLTVILEELRSVGMDGDVTVLIATGTHTGNTREELVEMLGAEVLSRCQVVNHDCRDEGQLVSMGTVAGDVPVALNRRWVEADVRITTGFVEPHFFAGFSGGPKMVAPGLAALETVMALHNAERIASPSATWGVVEGNPVHDAIREAAATCPPDFALDVLLNERKQITDVFAGELFAMHEEARTVAREVAMQQVDAPFPLVITTNSGFPLDQNLYQTVKGLSAAAQIVEDGGTIICAAECRNGLPDGSVYADLLASDSDIQSINDRLVRSDEVIADQWQVQVQARVQARARVLLKSDGLTAAEVEGAHLEPLDDIQTYIDQQHRSGHPSRIAVLPSGPQTIAYLPGG